MCEIMKLIKRDNRKGFTLAEALMAMVVLSIVAAAVLVPFSAGASVQAEGARRSVGAKLAGDLLERIVATDFDDIESIWADYSEAEGAVTDSTGNVVTDNMYSKFSRSVTVAEATLGSTTHYWVTVTVQWDSKEVGTLSRLIGP